MATIQRQDNCLAAKHPTYAGCVFTERKDVFRIKYLLTETQIRRNVKSSPLDSRAFDSKEPNCAAET